MVTYKVLILCVLVVEIHGWKYENGSNSGDGETCPCKRNEVLAYSFGGACPCKCISKGDQNSLECSPCPETSSLCEDNCCFLDVICDATGSCTSRESTDFVTAAKIAVLFALVVTCLAVMVALFRAFFLPRACNGRLRPSSQDDTRSLNSVQRFVLERLATRPPAYDHQPEKPPSYEECISVEQGTGVAPPTYGFAVNAVAEPPPYSAEDLPSSQEQTQASSTQELVLNPQTLVGVGLEENNEKVRDESTKTLPEETRGVDNAAFVMEESSSGWITTRTYSR